MIDITLEIQKIKFQSSVSGIVDTSLESAEVVDELSFHIITELGVFLINVTQHTINGIQFPTSSEAVFFILNF